ncbi:helix-turn-helix domain-containing protein [Pectobacterium colocasium]|uniref:Helix-turn-helix transcriptional regulator n=1 Tax=Pectobacterium polonicum TaxID=2485124 RepID=A0ABV1PBA8_9GAMM|nr:MULTISPECIES: helix-turn-helix transcriptional regulator [Pectobacterium]MBG0752260.1 Sugar fermentation stimulation protein B [Pectobacterium carotovorum subsp. carotovorum PCCS1]RYC41305.1 transcriptional regulator [Pectobacterium zantedeschiae]WJM80331.1 helix-turn-helix transcriptional regulator [Pectobacterium brasiliense]
MHATKNTEDWHQADIIAALRKKGTTVTEVSRNAGLSSTTLANALSRPWPKGEYLIAQAIGIAPEEIWPSRYFENGIFIDRKKKIRNKIINKKHK